MSDLPNIQENNEQVLNDIQSLQQIEQQLFNTLETNSNLTSEEQEQIVNKINQLSNMRINLYKTLSGVNNFYESALNTSVGTLKEQTSAIAIVESELNRSKQRLELLEEEKNNKIRLVEINDYYGDKYYEHSQLMKIVMFTLVPIIILAILNNKGILPNSIYYALLMIIVIIGLIFFLKKFRSIIMRDNMNYQEYAWAFDPSSVKVGSIDTTDPWYSPTNPSDLPDCVNEACCSDGQTWDPSINQCIGTSNVVESFTENMIHNVLTKQQQNKPNKYKPDVVLSQSYQPVMAESFVNY
jgi:hypothetical protein